MVLATKKNCQRVLAANLRVVSAMTGNPPYDNLMNIGLAGLSKRGSYYDHSTAY